MAVRREEFLRLGGFEPAMGPGSRYRSGGDWELAYRALRSGLVVVQASRATVTHFGARPFADGGVRRLIVNNYYGIGAGYGLHARGGDRIALWQAGAELGRTSSEIAQSVLRREGPIGVRRLTAFVVGFLTAMFVGRPEASGEPRELRDCAKDK